MGNATMTRQEVQRQAIWKANDRQRHSGKKPAMVEGSPAPQRRESDDGAAFFDAIARTTRFMKSVGHRAPLLVAADTVCIRFVAAVATDREGMLALRERQAKPEDAAPKGTEVFRSKEAHGLDLSALLGAGYRFVDAYKTPSGKEWAHAYCFWFARGPESVLALPGGVHEEVVKRFFAAPWARVVVFDNPAAETVPRNVTVNLTKRVSSHIVRLLALRL